jgi:hypothetical protein
MLYLLINNEQISSALAVEAQVSRADVFGMWRADGGIGQQDCFAPVPLCKELSK